VRDRPDDLFFLALAAPAQLAVHAAVLCCPLFITLLSIPILGEKVGVMRLSAVAVGFVGVIIRQRPWADAQSLQARVGWRVAPWCRALTYALNQDDARKLGVDSNGLGP